MKKIFLITNSLTPVIASYVPPLKYALRTRQILITQHLEYHFCIKKIYIYYHLNE